MQSGQVRRKHSFSSSLSDELDAMSFTTEESGDNDDDDGDDDDDDYFGETTTGLDDIDEIGEDDDM